MEWSTRFELLAMLVTNPRFAVLSALLITAAIVDCRTYKIPNWLTVGGTLFGLCYSAMAAVAPADGFLWATKGFLLVFAFTLPLYMLKTMGAGDVKLMAMAGAFLGASDGFYSVIATFIVGGVAALGLSLLNGVLGRMLGNIRSVAESMALSMIGGARPNAQIAAGISVGKMPYGVSIAGGTIGYLVAKQIGFV
jgi:prepilin peptidase CpaA